MRKEEEKGMRTEVVDLSILAVKSIE